MGAYEVGTDAGANLVIGCSISVHISRINIVFCICSESSLAL